MKLEVDLIFSRSQLLTQCEADGRGDIYTELYDNCSKQVSLGVQHKNIIKARA